MTKKSIFQPRGYGKEDFEMALKDSPYYISKVTGAVLNNILKKDNSDFVHQNKRFIEIAVADHIKRYKPTYEQFVTQTNASYFVDLVKNKRTEIHEKCAKGNKELT